MTTTKTKPFLISKKLVMEAYQRVKANRGAAGVDHQSLEAFEVRLKDNLYRLWNRMSSGSYLPPPVRAVTIPKKVGGERLLGIPTVSDRIAQMVVKLMLEPSVEPYFLADSYGYRPGKSALDAVEVTRKRCWKYDWVVEFDIRGLFDAIDHTLMMRALQRHTKCPWVVLYIERWLTAQIEMPDEQLVSRTKGTPQGGVISPLLANLFMHYAFDAWMTREFPDTPWCRYADDGVIHCRTEAEALQVKEALSTRMMGCLLELHPEKTRIVYCKDGSRKGTYADVAFDFLGYTFRRRPTKNTKANTVFSNFSPAASSASLKAMRQRVRRENFRNKPIYSLEAIARYFNPILRGWIQYYGRFYRSELYAVFRHFNQTLVAWAMRKYKRFHRRRVAASRFLQCIAEQQPDLFVHWKIGMRGSFV